MPSVAVVGTRGYPSYYGGFETAVRKLAPYLVSAGWDVTVYGRRGASQLHDRGLDTRVISRVTPGIETKKLSTLSYGLTSCLDASLRRPDVALVMNVANGYFLPLLRGRRIPTLVNVDGVEWDRAKWSPTAKKVFRVGAQFTARYADDLIFDSRAIESYWQDSFGASGHFIPYGGDVPPSLSVPDGLTHRGYVLLVARFVPENSVPEFFDAIPAIASLYPVVIVGSSGYHDLWDQKAHQLTTEYPSVSWLGHVRDDSLLLALWQHAGVYFHGHSVGGTNPALVQAMAAGSPVLARDTVYNREVLGPNGSVVDPDPVSISSRIIAMMSNPTELDRIADESQSRAALHYSWQQVCADYEIALRDLLNK